MEHNLASQVIGRRGQPASDLLPDGGLPKHLAPDLPKTLLPIRKECAVCGLLTSAVKLSTLVTVEEEKASCRERVLGASDTALVGNVPSTPVVTG